MFRWGPHFGEEPPISGSNGSGTLFFSHCTLKCIYCQNSKWSNGGQGEDLSIESLTDRFRFLVEKKCHNWNLVSPTPWLPQIEKAVMPLLEDGIRLQLRCRHQPRISRLNNVLPQYILTDTPTCPISCSHIEDHALAAFPQFLFVP